VVETYYLTVERTFMLVKLLIAEGNFVGGANISTPGTVVEVLT
jgi:hypothetical protein